VKQTNPTVLASALSLRWQGLATRERIGVAVAAALTLVAVTWLLAVAPALQALRSAKAAAPALDAQVQSMQALASEAVTLKAQRALSYDETLKALELSMKTLGPGSTLAVNEARATVNIRSASGDALAAWLAQVRANARLVPAELRLKQAANPAGSGVSWEGSAVFSVVSRP
jgi:general secretion pathway protein M